MKECIVVQKTKHRINSEPLVDMKIAKYLNKSAGPSETVNTLLQSGKCHIKKINAAVFSLVKEEAIHFN